MALVAQGIDAEFGSTTNGNMARQQMGPERLPTGTMIAINVAYKRWARRVARAAEVDAHTDAATPSIRPADSDSDQVSNEGTTIMKNLSSRPRSGRDG
jgi:hypothetical protein